MHGYYQHTRVRLRCQEGARELHRLYQFNWMDEIAAKEVRPGPNQPFDSQNSKKANKPALRFLKNLGFRGISFSSLLWRRLGFRGLPLNRRRPCAGVLVAECPGRFQQSAGSVQWRINSSSSRRVFAKRQFFESMILLGENRR